MTKTGNKRPVTRFENLRKTFAGKYGASEWTQEAVAKKVDATTKSYREWEKGNRIPDTYHLMKLAQLFHVSCDYLLGMSEYTHVGNEEMSKATGLSDAAINRLTQSSVMEWTSSIPELNALLTSENFWSILDELSLYRHHCGVEKNRPALIEKAKKRADNAIEQYENAKQGENADIIEQYRETAKNEIETVQRHKKDLNFSRKDKEIVWANLFKQFISLVNQIEQEVNNG